MYAILVNGVLESLCEKIRYVKQHERTGAFIETAEDDAVAIAVHGKLYNIKGQDTVRDAAQAIIIDADVSQYIFWNRVRIAENEKMSNETIAEIEDAICELDVTATKNLAMLEDALCELDEAVNGGGKV